MIKKKSFLQTTGLCLATVLAAAACTPTEGGEQLKYDTRGLTPQEYSVANLTAVDDYGRTVEVVDPTDVEKRYVGVFYFVWLGEQGMTGIYDVDQLEKLGENSPLYDPDNNDESPLHQFHFASEPLYGYYSMKDPWVVARHVEMLTMAGIDYLLFDCTNTVIYRDAVTVVLDTLLKFQKQGWNVPKAGFYTNSSSLSTVSSIYSAFYESGTYNDIWFRFEEDERPVIVGVSTANGGATDQTDASQFIPTDSNLYRFFNFYESQWPSSSSKNEERGLPWMQWGTPIPNENGNASVSVAQHSAASVFFSDQLPNSSRGYDGEGGKTEDWKQGSNFQWQWDTALKFADAGMVRNILVTSWNEWTAIKYKTGDPFFPTNSSGYTGRDVWFVDDYDAEYSRDVEPGKVYGDGFYIQLASNTRKFKTKAPTKYKMATKTIADLSDFTAWNNVFTEYADFAGDAMARDFANAAGQEHAYVDHSNRNDIVTMKVTHDAENVYFYVQTLDPITAYNGTDENWMNILISAGDTANSFAGFNYVINRKPGANGKTSVERCTANGWNWQSAGEADYFVSGNQMVVKIPLATLGLTADNVALSFKVADNVQKPGDILEYYISGDSAPIGRFGYAYGK